MTDGTSTSELFDEREQMSEELTQFDSDDVHSNTHSESNDDPTYPGPSIPVKQRRGRRKRVQKVDSSGETTAANPDKPYQCVWCWKCFPFLSVLQGHERIHTGEKPFACHYCDKTFAQRGSVKVHERKHTGQKPYQCSYCEKVFASQGNMKIHERQHTGFKPYVCMSKDCGKTFATVGSLRTHEITHSDIKQYQCDLCDRFFAHRTSLYTHKKRHELNATSNADQSPMEGLHSGSETPGAKDASTIVKTEAKEKRDFACKYCGKLFAFRHPLQAHERVHTGEKPFQCKYCPKSFAQQTSLIMHERSHTGDRRYACTLCDKRFIQPAALTAHKRTHTGEKPYKCTQCPKAFAHATSLRQHQMAHARETLVKKEVEGDTAEVEALKVKLEQWDEKQGELLKRRRSTHACFCGKTFAFQSMLDAHMRCHTGERPFGCQYCPKRFAQKATLQVHERTHTGEKPYSCKYCDRTFAQYGTKAVHEKTHTGLRHMPSHKCNLCGKMLSSPSALYTHRKTHGDKLYKCDLCTKAFTLRNYLKLHKKSVHSKEKKLHACEFCGKSFSYAGSLQVHVRTHTGERPYACQYCPKAFTSQGNLQSHERTHTGEKPYSCEQCGRCFAQKSQLSVHETTHANGGRKVSDFSCKFCGKRFAYASSLYVHVRLHTGDRPYSCRYCDKTFTNQGNMQVHERVHTGERPFKCPACDKSYAQKVGLKIHIEQCQYYALLRQSSANALNFGMSQHDGLVAPDAPPPQVLERTQKKRRLEQLLPKLLNNKSKLRNKRMKSEPVKVDPTQSNCIVENGISSPTLPVGELDSSCLKVSSTSVSNATIESANVTVPASNGHWLSPSMSVPVSLWSGLHSELDFGSEFVQDNFLSATTAQTDRFDGALLDQALLGDNNNLILSPLKVDTPCLSVELEHNTVSSAELQAQVKDWQNCLVHLIDAADD